MLNFMPIVVKFFKIYLGKATITHHSLPLLNILEQFTVIWNLVLYRYTIKGTNESRYAVVTSLVDIVTENLQLKCASSNIVHNIC